MSYSGLQLYTNMPDENTLRLSLEETDIPEPKGYGVVVEVKAAPINPSDLHKMFFTANLAKAKLSNSDKGLVLEAPIKMPPNGQLKSRLNSPIAVGNEGSGVVVAAGEKPEAQALIGKTVSLPGGGMYSQYCAFDARYCMEHKEDVSFAEAASSYINPMTALVLLETMRQAGHKALIQSVAASSLGQMINRLCLDDGIELINIVRRDEQMQLLKKQGAQRIINSSTQNFHHDLIAAVVETRATMLFDSTFGGHMVSDVLTSIEEAMQIGHEGFLDYQGAGVFKHAYVYGMLDPSPMKMEVSVGMNWSVSSFVMPIFAAKLPQETMLAFRNKVADEIQTTFKTNYGESISLQDVLQPENISRYYEKTTDGKYLVLPNG